MEPIVISRRQAADTGKTFFYTGKPCKLGHLSPRYTSTGGCKACLTQNFKPRRNGYSTSLIPYTNPHLWYVTDMPKEMRLRLRVYLQQCIFEFVRQAVLPTHPKAQELLESMQEVEARGNRASPDDPRNTD